jgi:predicted ATPase/DNA-binding XRE family transcriptional regulator
MQPEQDASFGAVLRRYRLAAGLTQEALARRAGLGATTIAALERNRHAAPREETLELLANALALTPPDRAHFVAAAHAPTVGTGPAVAHPAATLTPDPAQPPLLPPPTALIGRDAELAHLTQILQQPATRLLTLTGAGGVGKTSLALALAAGLAPHYADGVWLVELATLADPALVPAAVGAALGLRDDPGQSALATLTARLQGRRALLVLDNCEHLLDACAALLADLLRACADLRALATSRERLALAGERLYRVPSLASPDVQSLPPVERLAHYPAVQLFLARAQAQQPDFALTAHTAPAVASICARLDGIPLAIELAAACVAILPVEIIAQRLDDRFRLLSRGPRDALPRHQTLRALLDWSYGLLAAAAQALLAHLSVFAGGWTLETAEEVETAVHAGLSLGGEIPAVLDLLERLIDASLVQAIDPSSPGESRRYRLLETVRQYAAGRLAERGEAQVVQRAHANHYLALAEDATSHLRGPEQRAWLARLDAEQDNLRAALTWTRDQDEIEPALRLAGALWSYWWTRGALAEGRGWLEPLLARAAMVSPAVRARALGGAGNLAWAQGDL